MDLDILVLLPVTKNLENFWPFAAGFMEISLSVLELWHFEKSVPKTRFSACEKGGFLSLFEFFRKLPNFAGLWCPNHLTYRESLGIYGKIMSISFIWHLFI